MVRYRVATESAKIFASAAGDEVIGTLGQGDLVEVRPRVDLRRVRDDGVLVPIEFEDREGFLRVSDLVVRSELDGFARSLFMLQFVPAFLLAGAFLGRGDPFPRVEAIAATALILAVAVPIGLGLVTARGRNRLVVCLTYLTLQTILLLFGFFVGCSASIRS